MKQREGAGNDNDPRGVKGERVGKEQRADRGSDR